MKIYAYKIYDMILSRPFRRDTVHKLYYLDDEQMENYILDGYNFCNDISEFINVVKFTPIRNLELNNVTELDFRKIIRISARHLLGLSLISSICDFRILSECEKLVKIDVSTDAKTVYLPDISKLSGLKEIEFSLQANEIENTQGLVSESLTDLKIDTCYRPGFAVVDAKIEDFSFLLKLPNLKNLTLMLTSKDNPYDDLVTLSKLTELTELKLAPDYFTKEEYAWLASKLTHTRGLDGCYCIRKDRQKDCIRYIMLGESEDMIFEDGSRMEEYYKTFKELVNKFKNHPTPPKRN